MSCNGKNFGIKTRKSASELSLYNEQESGHMAFWSFLASSIRSVFRLFQGPPVSKAFGFHCRKLKPAF